ncbi:MAG: tetratricopeptide repeat protein [Pyrinomonadaceae bacterium MAG19_C2-C3]|nr:tetratricopeptide repeat protein [Pyrinomonadaceae bacterium MAG19_C2-C3]
MRKHLIVYLSIVVVGLAIVFAIRAMTRPTASKPIASKSSATAAASLAALPPNSLASPSDKQIMLAGNLIEASATDAKGYNLLASAFMQKARETGDFGFNARAEAALNKSFEVAPDSYDALKLRAKLLLTQHRFREALDAANKARQLNPRDHDIYGALTDALVELGQYPQAVEAAQTMIDLRPETASYARVSYLRALHGETQGSIAAMKMACTSANLASPEQVAWCAVQLGDELFNAGSLKDAEREYDRALYVFPNYYSALAAKARARVAAGDTQAAINLLTQAQKRVPLPETAVALGDLYFKLGLEDDAARQYKLLEFIEKSGDDSAATYSQQLALFYANTDTRLDDALRIARREREGRQDIYTCDLLAWALYKNGDLENAKIASDEALRLGTRDARLHYHAGMIQAALSNRAEAKKHLNLALEINPHFDVRQADIARTTLKKL